MFSSELTFQCLKGQREGHTLMAVVSGGISEHVGNRLPANNLRNMLTPCCVEGAVSRARPKARVQVDQWGGCPSTANRALAHASSLTQPLLEVD